MKRLYLLRHAQAASAFDHSDIERQLTPKGINDAKALGRTMQAKDYIPALTLCSPAARTKQTLEGLSDTLGALKVENPEHLYGAAPGDMLSLIQGTKNEYTSLLIVAHNPTIHHIAAMLCDENSEHYNNVNMQYAPCTMSVLDCNVEKWQHIQPGQNRLVDLIKPET